MEIPATQHSIQLGGWISTGFSWAIMTRIEWSSQSIFFHFEPQQLSILSFETLLHIFNCSSSYDILELGYHFYWRSRTLSSITPPSWSFCPSPLLSILLEGVQCGDRWRVGIKHHILHYIFMRQVSSTQQLPIPLLHGLRGRSLLARTSLWDMDTLCSRMKPSVMVSQEELQEKFAGQVWAYAKLCLATFEQLKLHLFQGKCCQRGGGGHTDCVPSLVQSPVLHKPIKRATLIVQSRNRFIQHGHIEKRDKGIHHFASHLQQRERVKVWSHPPLTHHYLGFSSLIL